MNAAAYLNADVPAITGQQIDQINWLMAQNLTSNPKFSGQFNYGEVQQAIWEILNYSDAEITQGINTRLLRDNNRQTVEQIDVDLLVNQSLDAVNSGTNVLPTDAFFSMVIDPDGVRNPLFYSVIQGSLVIMCGRMSTGMVFRMLEKWV